MTFGAVAGELLKIIAPKTFNSLLHRNTRHVADYWKAPASTFETCSSSNAATHAKAISSQSAPKVLWQSRRSAWSRPSR